MASARHLSDGSSSTGISSGATHMAAPSRQIAAHRAVSNRGLQVSRSSIVGNSAPREAIRTGESKPEFLPTGRSCRIGRRWRRPWVDRIRSSGLARLERRGCLDRLLRDLALVAGRSDAELILSKLVGHSWVCHQTSALCTAESSWIATNLLQVAMPSTS